MTLQLTNSQSPQPGLGSDISTVTIPMVLSEMNVGTPRDHLESNSFAFLRNIYPPRNDTLATRPGLVSSFQLDGAEFIHWFDKITDFGSTSNPTYWIIAAGNKIRAAINPEDFNLPTASSDVELTKLVNGKPRSSHVTATPLNSVSEYAYLATDEGMWKYAPESGKWVKWGIDSPRYPVVVSSQRPLEGKKITDCTSSAPGSSAEDGNVWYVRGTAGALSQINRINTTISKVVALPGQVTTGKYWLAELASTGNGVQPATRVKIGSGDDYVVIEGVNYGSGSAVILAIGVSPDQSPTPDNLNVYTIVTDKQLAGINGNSIIIVGTGGGEKLATLRSIVPGLDNNTFCYEIICDDASYTPTVGTAIRVVPSIKFYMERPPIVGETVICKAYKSTITVSGGANNATGSFQHNIPLDLSTLETKAATKDDFLCFGFWTTDILKINEARIWLDLDTDTSNTYPMVPLTEFQRNYMYYAFDAGELEKYATIESSIRQAQSGSVTSKRASDATERSITAANILNPYIIGRNNAFSQNGKLGKLGQRLFNKLLGLPEYAPAGAYNTISGKAQWFQFAIPLAQLSRYGTDLTRDLKDCKGIQFSANVSGTIDVAISSIWIGGGFTPDTTYVDGLVATEQGFFYTYVGRNSSTGDESNAAPPTRTGLTLNRQEGVVRMFKHPDPQVDVLDVYRFSAVTQNWNYVGTAPNKSMNGGLPFIIDKYSDIEISGNRLLRFDNFSPFPVASKPLKGICKVIGNKIEWLSGDKFNIGLPRGTEIIVGGNTHFLYSQPTSEGALETINFVGSYEQTEFIIPNPVLLGQGLPYVFGPYNLAQGFGGGLEGQVVFAFGDLENPGRLYWTNPNRIGTADDGNYVDISSGSEPIVSGGIYDGRAYLWTNKRQFALTPKILGNSELTFVAQQVANSKGTVAFRCTSSGEYQYVVNQEGIFASQGGQPVSISNGIRYLFPVGDSDASITNVYIEGLDNFPIPAPDFSKADYWSLTAHKDVLSFIYCDRAFNFFQLQFLIAQGAWVYNAYRHNPQLTGSLGATAQAVSENRVSRPMLYAVNNHICESDWSTVYDMDFPITSMVWTPVYTFATPRVTKFFADFRIKARGTGIKVNVVSGSPIPPSLDSAANLVSEKQFSTVGGYWIYKLVTFAKDSLIGPPLTLLTTGVGLDFQHTPVNAQDRFFLNELSISYAPKGEVIELRSTDWEDAGSPLMKTLRGVMLKGNFPVDTVLEVKLDNGNAIQIKVPKTDSEWVQVQIPGRPNFRQLKLSQADTVLPVDFMLYRAEWIVEPATELVSWIKTGKLDFGDCGWKILPKFMLDFVERDESVGENAGELSSKVKVKIIKYGVRGKILDETEYEISVADRRHWFMGNAVKFLEAAIEITPIGEGKKLGLGGGSCFHVASWNRPPETPMREVRPIGTPVNGGLNGTGQDGTVIL